MSLTVDTVYSVSGLSAIRTDTGTSTIKEVLVLGYNNPLDGGGGIFYWDSTSATTPDNYLVIQIGSTTGRWKRMYSGALNVRWFGAVGDGIVDDTAAIAAAIAVINTATVKQPLFFPAGKYLIKSQITLRADLSIVGEGIDKTFFVYNSTYSVTGAMFLGDVGNSDLSFKDFSIIGTVGNTKKIDAAIQMNSYPNNAKRILFERIKINDFYGHGLMFGGTGSNENHSNDEIIIKDSIFYNIGDPANYVITSNTPTITFNAIHLQQTTRKAMIINNVIYSVGGDGIFSWGWSQNTRQSYPDDDFADYQILGNNISKCWMGIEVNGGGLARKITIQDNIIKYCTANGLFLLSIDSQWGIISNNTLISVNRSAIECTLNQGLISGNVINITSYKTGSGGIPSTAIMDKVQAMSLYGFAVKVSNNNITLDKSGGDSFTATDYNGIALVSRTTDSLQPMSYDGIIDFAGYFDICNNTIHGFTSRAIDATVEKIRKVNVYDNTFLSRNCAGDPLRIYGYNWIVKNNIFDLTNSTPGGYAIGVFTTLQSDDTKSIVAGNLIINDAWLIGNTSQFIAYRNEYRNTSSEVSYLQFPAPPVTSAQRTALTGREGIEVYQTDGTIGLYIFTSSAWKRVDLV